LEPVITVVRKGPFWSEKRRETEMFSPAKQKGVIPLVLAGFLMFGAVSAEARDHHRRGDRTTKGAVIGAVAGTLFQIMQGNTEGHEILAGAVVGGTIGAAVGAGTDDRYHDRYRDGYYDDDGYYYEDGYYQDDGYWDGEDWDSHRDRDDRWDDHEYRDDGYYDHYDRRPSHRHNDHCNHH
jgi:hypothetical protein